MGAAVLRVGTAQPRGPPTIMGDRSGCPGKGLGNFHRQVQCCLPRFYWKIKTFLNKTEPKDAGGPPLPLKQRTGGHEDGAWLDRAGDPVLLWKDPGGRQDQQQRQANRDHLPGLGKMTEKMGAFTPFFLRPPRAPHPGTSAPRPSLSCEKATTTGQAASKQTTAIVNPN